MAGGTTKANWGTETESGYSVFFEIEYKDIDEAINDVPTVEALIETSKLKPYTRSKSSGGYTKKPKNYVEGRACPKCGAKLVVVESANPKAPKVKCETQRYFDGKTSGCDYVEWDDPVITGPATNTASQPINKATPGQIKFIQDLQAEGKIDYTIDAQKISFDAAKKLLSTVR